MLVRNLVDIPAGQEAQVQVVFTNESETHEALTSAIVYVDAGSNPDGLQVYMDGMPLTSGVEMWIEYGVPITQARPITFRIYDAEQGVVLGTVHYIDAMGHCSAEPFKGFNIVVTQQGGKQQVQKVIMQ